MTYATDYRAHPYVSNSALTMLRRETLPVEQCNDLTQAFRMGNLVDAMITRHLSCDFVRKQADDIEYTDEEWQIGLQSKRVFMADPFCELLHKSSIGQRDFYREDEYGPENFMKYRQGRKCLYDLWNPITGWGVDIKTTTAKTLTGFYEQIDYLDYDRARYWYMDVSGAKRDMIIGISKVNFKVFKIFIEHGDQMWQRGRDKAELLAFQMYMLKNQPDGMEKLKVTRDLFLKSFEQ